MLLCPPPCSAPALRSSALPPALPPSGRCEFWYNVFAHCFCCVLCLGKKYHARDEKAPCHRLATRKQASLPDGQRCQWIEGLYFRFYQWFYFCINSPAKGFLWYPKAKVDKATGKKTKVRVVITVLGSLYLFWTRVLAGVGRFIFGRVRCLVVWLRATRLCW